MMLIDL